MSSKPFIENCLFYFNIAGLHPKNQTRLTKTIFGYFLLTTTLIIVFMLLEITVNWNGLASLLDGANSLVGYVQLFLKLVIFLLSLKKFARMLDALEQFWPIEQAGPEVKTEIEAVHGHVNKILKAIKICLFIVVFTYFSVLVFADTRTFPLQIYQPFDLLTSPYYEIVNFILCSNTLFLVSFTIGFDLLFVTLVTHVSSELKMLKYRFANLKINGNIKEEESTTLKDLGKLVDHHGFILQFIKQMNSFYSLIMLSIFGSSMFCICLGLFSLSAEGFPPRMKVLSQCITFLMCYCGELFIFCFGGNVITVESTTVGDAVYESDWWVKTQPKLRRAIVLVILRSQKVEKIVAGGMISLSLESFTDVMKTGMSFYTLMSAVYTEGAESA